LKARQAKERLLRGRTRRLARGKQDIQISPQTATTTATATVKVGVAIRVAEKGTEIEWSSVGRSSIRGKGTKAAK
jgi:hypothetical protein